MPPDPRRCGRGSRFAGVVLALGVAVTGCGDDDGASATSTTICYEAPAPTNSPQAPPATTCTDRPEPLLPSEDEQVLLRYAADQASFAGEWVENRITIYGFAEDPATHTAAMAELVPDTSTYEVREVPYSETELHELQIIAEQFLVEAWVASGRELWEDVPEGEMQDRPFTSRDVPGNSVKVTGWPDELVDALRDAHPDIPLTVVEE